MTLEAFCHWCRSTITLTDDGRYPAHITELASIGSFIDLVEKMCPSSGTKATVWWKQGETQ